MKELYIDSNKLTKIEGLDTLQSLKVLVLHSNQITHIENLKALTSVRKLSLARNKIHEIGSSLDRLGSLQELNLAGNLIGSFSEIRRLTHLKSLQVLYFNDPHFGDNPVCNLCNYHTYALFHLQFLDILDSIRLSEEATQLAEATFLKKQMYYNMRIKMCKRNTTNLLRKGAETCRERLRHLDGKKKQLMRQVSTRLYARTHKQTYAWMVLGWCLLVLHLA